jgi:hypothetical protein
MLSWLVGITGAAISFILFSIIFGGLNKSMLRLFIPIQKFTNKLQRKRLYSNLTVIILIMISASINYYYKLGNLMYGSLIGFFFALKVIIFDELATVKN